MTATSCDFDTGAPCVVQTVSTHHALTVRDEVQIEIFGRLVGFASSHRDDHTHPARTLAADTGSGAPTSDPVYVRSGERCSACRWFEVRIFTVDYEYTELCTCGIDPSFQLEGAVHDASCGETPARAKYLVLTYGITVVPGETHKRRATWTNSPYEIIEVLTQRNNGKAFLPATSAQVIAQAAAADRGIENAYLNRAVV